MILTSTHCTRVGQPSAATLRRLGAPLVVVLFATFPALPAWSWGGQGHRHITQGAIPHLPLPLRGFFAANQSEVVSRAGDEPSGRHYIDIDYYPEFHAGTFPRDLGQLIAIHGFSIVDGNGRGPWTYNDLLNALSAGMAAAQTPQDWVDLLPTAAAMAHYIEDLHNPLHLTMNYDGQLTGNNGIHSRYETSMISRRINELTFVPATAVYLPSPIDFVFDGIDDHYPYVADIIAADDAAPGSTGSTAYYNSLWADTGDFTKQLFQEASVAVASSWYTAWINAGSPRTFLANMADFEADGDVDSRDLVVWTNSFGIDAIADANSNGLTDGHDFLLWQRQVSPTAIAAGVPEPSAAALAIAVLAAMASPLRRRLERRVERPSFVL